MLARLAPEVARRVHPGNYEAILNALVRRMDGEASNEAATPFAFAVYGVDRGEAETSRRIETTLDAQIRDGLLEEIAELDRRQPGPARHVYRRRLRHRRCQVTEVQAKKTPPGGGSCRAEPPAVVDPDHRAPVTHRDLNANANSRYARPAIGPAWPSMTGRNEHSVASAS